MTLVYHMLFLTCTSHLPRSTIKSMWRNCRGYSRNRPKGGRNSPQHYTSTHFSDCISQFSLTKSPEASLKSLRQIGLKTQYNNFCCQKNLFIQIKGWSCIRSNPLLECPLNYDKIINIYHKEWKYMQFIFFVLIVNSKFFYSYISTFILQLRRYIESLLTLSIHGKLLSISLLSSAYAQFGEL